jgi:ankyrin repeat protein
MTELLKSPLSNEILNCLIKANIDILLGQAKKENREPEVKQLLQNKGITSTELNGFTPLFAAIFFGHTELVKMLIKQGGDLEQTAQGQISGLEFAQAMNRKDITLLLMSAQSNAVGHAVTDTTTHESKACNPKISISLSDLSLKSGSDSRAPWQKGKILG